MMVWKSEWKAPYWSGVGGPFYGFNTCPFLLYFGKEGNKLGRENPVIYDDVKRGEPEKFCS